jgi:thiol-disulfide isomerase/thioredoxin
VASSQAGEWALVVFAAHWCHYCNREIPHLIEIQLDEVLPTTLSIVLVSTAADPQRPNYPPHQWLENHGWTHPVIADNSDLEAASSFDVGGFPFVVLIDPEGEVHMRWSGERDAVAWERALDAVAS